MAATAPTFATGTVQLFTAATTNGIAGQIGAGSVGIIGWIPMKSNNWRQLSSAATPTQVSGYLADVCYLPSRIRQCDRICIQPSITNPAGISSFGLNYIPTTGEGYVVRWDLQLVSNQTFTIQRLNSNNTVYPATAAVNLVTSTPYTKAASDWGVMQIVRNGDVAVITVSICPDNAGAPNLGSPKVSATYTDTYAPLAAGGYAFISDSSGGASAPITAVRVDEAPQFSISQQLINNGQRLLVTLAGTNLTWTGTPFSITTSPASGSGSALLSQTLISGTSATLLLNVGTQDQTIWISDGNTSNSLVACYYGQRETRNFYAAIRGTSISSADANGNNIAVLLTQAQLTSQFGANFLYLYGVTPDPTGQYIYVMGPAVSGSTGGVMLKYTVAGAYLSTIFTTTYVNPRKACFLPNGDLVFVEFGNAGKLWRIHNDTTITAFSPAYTSTNGYGMCLFFDPTLGYTTLLQAGWGNPTIEQFDINTGAHIKTWFNGGVFASSKCADVVQAGDGNVYAANWDNGTVEQFSPLGVHLATGSLVSGSGHTHCITAASDGRIIAGCELNGTASSFEPQLLLGGQYGVGITTTELVDFKVGQAPGFPLAPWPLLASTQNSYAKSVILASAPTTPMWYATRPDGTTAIPLSAANIVNVSGTAYTWKPSFPPGLGLTAWLIDAAAATPLDRLDDPVTMIWNPALNGAPVAGSAAGVIQGIQGHTNRIH